MKFIIRLDNANFESPLLEMEAENHQDLCEQVFGRIEIISGEDLD
jgi:hypothetical protein